MTFLIANMPRKDLATLTADFLLGHVRHAYATWKSVPWKDQVPEEIFLNDVLPYASINERRDAWREDLHDRFQEHVEGVTSPGKAAAILNQRVFPQVGVKYSTQRPKADQSPYESIEAGLASCTGLSILLIDACRAVGVPARFVGTPRWSDNSGNHSWVEVWDDGWHFTGAAEPTGDELDRAWFTGRARNAQRDHRLHAIYAVSYRKTPIDFPLIWNSEYDDLSGINVTDRYTRFGRPVPDGKVRVRFRIVDDHDVRHSATLAVTRAENAPDALVFVGTSKDESFDANDHLTAFLEQGAAYSARIVGTAASFEFTANEDEQLINCTVPPSGKDDSTNSTSALEELHAYLAQSRSQRPPLAEQAFARRSISAGEAAFATKLLWTDLAAEIRATRAAEMKEKVLRHGDLEMPFSFITYGEPTQSGRSLYLSMHGGGGAPTRVNDQQWENQKTLYRPEEGVYLAPRAPTNTWNLWHQGHIDPLFDRLISNLVVFENVDPNRVYLMGYSAGGDGVYQLAPRMADRLAAAAMMAGHPNETSPLGLRNLPFALHMGGKDSAYNRNQIARDWKKRLAELQEKDPDGYPHYVEIHEDKGHWMDREDAKAVQWMAKQTRNVTPSRVVWQQDDVTHSRFYWLATDEPAARALVSAEIQTTDQGQTICITSETVSRLRIRLRDEMLDFSKPVTVTFNDETAYQGKVQRTVHTIATTMTEREDPAAVFSAEIEVSLPASAGENPR